MTRTYHGRPVATIMGKELIETPDYGLQRCCDLCALYGTNPTTGDPGCIVPNEDHKLHLRCGVNATFYVEANDDAWDEHVAKLVTLRMEGRLPQPQPLTFQEKD